MPKAPKNQALDIDLSDLDFDDESTNDDLTDAPSTLDPAQSLDDRLSRVSKDSEDGVGAKQLGSDIDNQLLASIDDLEAEYISNLELRALIARRHLSEASADEPQDPVALAAAKKLYMDALKNQLDFHEFLFQKYLVFLTNDYKNKLETEPLLSNAEIANVNSSIKPVNMSGKSVSSGEIKILRYEVEKNFGLGNLGEDFFRTPARLKQHEESVKKIASELNLPDGWEPVLEDYENALDEIAKIPGRMERRAAYQGYALNTRPRHFIVKSTDPALNKHDLMFELDPNDASLIPTPDEVRTVLDAFNEFNASISLANLQNIMQGSRTNTRNRSGALKIIIGTHLPVPKIGRFFGRDDLTDLIYDCNGITVDDGRLYLNLNNLRNFDIEIERARQAGRYWRNPKSALDKIKTTLQHELGHQVMYAVKRVGTPNGPAVHYNEPNGPRGTYAATNENEHFAESISRYIGTGEASDRIKKILADNNLIKAGPSQASPDAESINEPDANPTPDAEASPNSSDQEALEEAYKELRAANRVQMMEPKASANKKLNDDDYTVMDILRFGPVMAIDDIKREAENENFSSGGSLSKTIASLKRKGILTAVPGDKERLALTESGIEKVAAVQAGRAKERRDAEERSQAQREKAAADIAAKEAAKTPEQKAQEEAAAAEFRANRAALDKQRLAEDEEKRLFYETNLTPSENRAVEFLQGALFDDDISNIGEGSAFDIATFKDALEDSFDQRTRLPEGQTPVSLTEEIMSSLKKKGFVTTVRGDKESLALTKLGAEKVRKSLGLPSAPDANPTPDADSVMPAKNEALDIDLSDFDFDDDDDGKIEPSEIAAAAKALAASAGHGMKLDGKKSARTIDTTGVPIKIGSSGKPGVAPSAQATDIKNNILALGNQVLEAAYLVSETKLREKGLLPEGMSIKEYAPIARLDEQRIIEISEKEDFEGRQKLADLMEAEVNRIAKDITEEEFKQYLADRKITKDKASTMTLDDRYESYYFSSESNPAYRYAGGPGTIWAKDKLDEDNNAGDVKFETGGGFNYTFRNAIPYGWTNRQRIAALKLVREGKLSDYKELDNLAYEIRRSNGKATYTRQNRFADKSKGIIRDSILDEMKKAGVEFDSVDMSEYVGKYEPRAKRRSAWAGLSKKTRAELEAAFEYIPKDILLAARAYLNEIKRAAPNDSTSGIIGIIESEARAHFNTVAWGGYLRGNTADDFLHEFWHFFQRVNPDIAVLENAFLYDRLKDSNGNLSNTEKADYSYQFTNGNFSSPYTTKQYPYQGLYFDAKNNYTEVTTVGMQDLFTSPGRYSAADTGMVIVGKGRNKVIYRNPYMDIATGIWYTNSSMTEKIPGQENQKNIFVRGRAAHLGDDNEFKAFNIGLMLSVLDWENK